MQPRSATFAWTLLALTGLPGSTLALGLGELTVESKLSEPLAGEIELLGASTDELSWLEIGLASRRQHRDSGLAYTDAHTRLNFERAFNRDGKPIIRVSSEVAIAEPILSFIVQVGSTSSGRVLREYTTLLDPPGYAGTVPGTHSPSTAAVTISPTQAHDTSTAPITVEVLEPAAASRGAADTALVRVARGDTLWVLATRLAKGSGVAGSQLAVALFHANPGAFIAGDVNSLRAGATLSIPDLAEARRLTAREARVFLRGANTAPDVLVAKAPAPPPPEPSRAPAPEVAVATQSQPDPRTVRLVDVLLDALPPDRMELERVSVQRDAQTRVSLALADELRESRDQRAQMQRQIAALNDRYAELLSAIEDNAQLMLRLTTELTSLDPIPEVQIGPAPETQAARVSGTPHSAPAVERADMSGTLLVLGGALIGWMLRRRSPR